MRMGQDMTRDLQENMAEGERAETEDTSSQEMKESNPAFLRYLQFKVLTNIIKDSRDSPNLSFWFST